ncbi:MAG TPA: TIGR03620 family F420-dependent LLM class oxidoreductase [Acidimicrobiales bacterium]|nr:TIGR03620 family F420-dependent LLM class oxidoreductase [Acidimicrobiales bacterium]
MREFPPSLQRLSGTVGLWTSTHEWIAPDQLSELALDVESLGYAAMWLDESWGREALTGAGLLLTPTSNLVVATGIASIWARDAVATVNAARTLNAAYDDRFVLGLGVSHRPLVERLRGHVYAAPVRAMREYLDAMDAAPMLAAESGHPYARVLAALGPKMLELGASRTDGVLPYLVTVEHTAGTRRLIGDAFLAVEQAVVLGQDRAEFLRRAHQHLEHYTGLENYTNNWRRLGFDDTDLVRGGSDRLCDALVVHGDESVVASRIAEHRNAGADHVCLQVLGDDVTSAPRDEWRRLAPAVIGRN